MSAIATAAAVAVAAADAADLAVATQAAHTQGNPSHSRPHPRARRCGA